MTRIFTLVAGIVFLVAGVLGFMPGITVDHVLVLIPGNTGSHEYLLGIFGQHRAWEKAAEHALVHYRAAGSPPATCLGQIGYSLYWGPRPVPEAIARCDELLREADDLSSRAYLTPFLGGLEAQQGNLERGRDLVATAQAIFEDLGHAETPMHLEMIAVHIELLAELRTQYAGWDITVERTADRRTRSFIARKSVA